MASEARRDLALEGLATMKGSRYEAYPMRYWDTPGMADSVDRVWQQLQLKKGKGLSLSEVIASYLEHEKFKGI